MENERPQPNDMQRLKELLREAGLKSFRMDANRRALFFCGRTREWVIIARIRDGWLNLYTWVCELPKERGPRGRMLEAALASNRLMTLTKFATAEALVLEVDYRAEHVDHDALRDLIELLHGNAEEYYPRIFRTVTGDDVLESLADLKVAGTT